MLLSGSVETATAEHVGQDLRLISASLSPAVTIAPSTRPIQKHVDKLAINEALVCEACISFAPHEMIGHSMTGARIENLALVFLLKGHEHDALTLQLLYEQ